MEVEKFNGIPLMSQKAAIELDKDMMKEPGFTNDQLMELAGLSIAQALVDCYPAAKSALVICGPGNNGGDAFVASRHLCHFGFDIKVVYPKRVKKPVFDNFLAQMEDLKIEVSPELPDPKTWGEQFDVIVDGVFGSSFNAAREIRAPFDVVIKSLAETKVPIVSIDIPSG